MKIPSWTFLLWLLVASIPCMAQAAKKVGDKISFVLADGSTKSGTIIKIDPEGVSLLTDDGGGKVLFSKMKKEDQASWGYDPQKLAAFEKEQKLAEDDRKLRVAQFNKNVASTDLKRTQDAEWQKRLASAFSLTAEVEQQTKQGLLVWKSFPQSDDVEVEGAPVGEMYLIEGLQGDFTVDEVIRVTVIDDGNFTYTTARGLKNTISQYILAPDSKIQQIAYSSSPAAAAKDHFSIDDVPR